jgi:hypothetical protein
MSTFIYTLQRKIQELQNFKYNLINENNNLRSRLQMLTEADTGNDGGRGPEVTGVEELTQTYQGEGGMSAYDVRTVDNPMHYYTGFQVTNPPFELPNTWSTYVYNEDGGTLLIPYAYYSEHTQVGWQVPSLTPNMIGQIVALNLLHNPQFSFNNFQSANQIYTAFKQAITSLPVGQGDTPIVQQFLTVTSNPNFRQWVSSGLNSVIQRDSNGVWDMSANWPY